MDLDKIANNAYHPLKGFLNKDDLLSVIEKYRLTNGECWPMPIILDFDKEDIKSFKMGSDIILKESSGKDIAELKIEDIYQVNKKKLAKDIFLTNDENHPGVRWWLGLKDFFVGGKIKLINKPIFFNAEDELSPQEVKHIIKNNGFKTIVGFHTRNPIHRAHEYLQRCALEITDCLVIHPVVGKKKKGDFTAGAIRASYNAMLESYYPKNRIIFSVLSTYSRYAGPREALFTAIIRRNYGCTHFIVGRDHTGVANYYGRYDSHKIFNQFSDLGITPLKFYEPVYCRHCNNIVTEKTCIHKNGFIKISGTKIRELISKSSNIKDIYLRKEVLESILNYGKNNKIFVD
ncbi:sulfate adenylyltransferase [Candidatus Parcubacteria bacterium]|nr:sulfate adenylyltransferase [Candidatus Parcubacteria bacterium]